MERKIHIIDAQDISLGRLATKIAILLQGKHKINFDPSKDMGDFVVVKNIHKAKLTGEKWKNKKYYSHSGYPGGLKVKSAQEIFEKDKMKLLRLIISGMLPKNRLRKRMLKRLKIE